MRPALLLPLLLSIAAAAPLAAQRDDSRGVGAMVEEARRLTDRDDERAGPLVERALARLTRPEDRAVRVKALAVRCWTRAGVVEPAALIAAADSAIAEAERAGDARARADLRVCRGYGYADAGRGAGAAADYDFGAAEGRRLKDDRLLAVALMLRGELRYYRGELGGALEDLNQAYALYTRLDNASRVRHAERIANLYADRRVAQYDRAIEYYRQVLAAHQRPDRRATWPPAGSTWAARWSRRATWSGAGLLPPRAGSSGGWATRRWPRSASAPSASCWPGWGARTRRCAWLDQALAVRPLGRRGATRRSRGSRAGSRCAGGAHGRRAARPGGGAGALRGARRTRASWRRCRTSARRRWPPPATGAARTRRARAGAAAARAGRKAARGAHLAAARAVRHGEEGAGEPRPGARERAARAGAEGRHAHPLAADGGDRAQRGIIGDPGRARGPPPPQRAAAARAGAHRRADAPSQPPPPAAVADERVEAARRAPAR
jgi:tetratricopeptide (TPR) repeat protein